MQMDFYPVHTDVRDPSTYVYQSENEEVVEERHLFFYLRNDPYQMHNLAKTDNQSAVADQLCDRLPAWSRDTQRHAARP